MPKVTVVMPTYNSAHTVRKAIESILSQTFTDWDMIIVNEKDSDDGTVEIVKEYAGKDSRILLLQNDTRLGLAESLNKKQVAYLDVHRDVGVLGTWQHLYGKSNWTYTPPLTHGKNAWLSSFSIAIYVIPP